MPKKFSTICFSLILLGLFGISVCAQSDASTQTGRQTQQKEDLPKNIRETLAKQRIEREKKEYEELLKRSQEAVKLSEELEKSFSDSNEMSLDDRKKLERLEKLVKKIRTELGADDDESESKMETEKNEKPSTMVNAFRTLQTNAAQLLNEIKKSTRYSISVVAIQTSNMLLKLVKFIRFGN